MSHKLSPQAAPKPRSLLGALVRKKPLDTRTDTSLDRCLGLTELTALGVGSTLGLGLYVLAGQAASNKAGPAVVLSFGLAALASLFSALCYAEFAGRVPRAGSAYVYSYITVGEFAAFVIGWNLLLEYVIGAASVARGFSAYLRFVFERLLMASSSSDALTQHPATFGPKHSNFTTATGSRPSTTGLLNLASEYLRAHFDWAALLIVGCVTAAMMTGVKQSTKLTTAFTALNLLVVAAVVLCSLNSLDPLNWSLGPEQVPPGRGKGGFLPYGWSGALAASATCFFGFIGFDTIASSAEEARNPRRNVPLAILLSLAISCGAYMSVAVAQTLLWPYYDQDKVTILPHIFGALGLHTAHWLVLVGALAGLASSQLAGMYPLPRIVYSMAQDRLIYGQLAKVDKRLRLPVRATLAGGLLVAVLACMLDIEALADMVSIGTLAAYTLVAISVLILRYQPEHDTNRQVAEASPTSKDTPKSSATGVSRLIWLLVALSTLVDSLFLYLVRSASETLASGWLAGAAWAALAGLVATMAMLALRPGAGPEHQDAFRVPWVPLVPTLSILVNVFLMLNLSWLTWLRFVAWMSVGLFIYFSYGIWHSRASLTAQQHCQLTASGRLSPSNYES